MAISTSKNSCNEVGENHERTYLKCHVKELTSRSGMKIGRFKFSWAQGNIIYDQRSPTAKRKKEEEKARVDANGQ